MKLLRIFGIDIELHWTFLLFLLFILISGGLDAAVTVFLLFGSVLLHELSHSLVARAHNIRVRKILLLPVGGVAMIDVFAMPAKTEFVVALAGPLFSFFLAGVGFVLELSPIEPVKGMGSVLKDANLILGLFNLLPAIPLDGGRVWRAWRQMSTDYLQATREAVRMSHLLVLTLLAAAFISAYLLGAWGFLLWNVFIALFVYSGAGSELESALFKTASDDLKVMDAMHAEFAVASAENSLEEAHDLALQNMTRNLLLIDESKHHKYHVVNVDLFAKVRKNLWATTKVGQLAAAPLSVSPHTSLLAAWKEMRERGVELAPVVDAGALVGVVTEADIERMIHLKKIALVA